MTTAQNFVVAARPASLVGMVFGWALRTFPAVVAVVAVVAAALAASPASARVEHWPPEAHDFVDVHRAAWFREARLFPRVVDTVDIDAVVAGMTLEQKVGQMLLVSFAGQHLDGAIAAMLDELQPGGVALFSRNIATPAQTVGLIRGVRGHDLRVGGVRVPMFVAVDQEGGNVVRLRSQATVLPTAMALGATNDPTLARAVGRTLGRDLVAWGFNMNLAPVLDVNSNPKNPVIGTRSFGADPERVAAIGTAYIAGLAEEGVVAVAKHFPGHGDTDVDSHLGLPVLQHDRARLDAVELLPFARAFAAGLPAVMTGHIALPQIAEAADLPATISPAVLTGIVRRDLRWDGIIMTDGLEMHGVVDRYGSGEAAVQAVLAGADVVMVLWNPLTKREVRTALLRAVHEGRLPSARIDDAVRRVLAQKARAGLFSRPILEPQPAERALKHNDRSAVGEVARRAITIARDRGHVLPLAPDARVVVAAAQGAFVAELARTAHVRTMTLSWNPDALRARIEGLAIAATARDADVVVVGVQTPQQARVVRVVQDAILAARARGERAPAIVAVSFASPWLVTQFPEVDGYVCAFGWRDESVRAAARVVAGTLPARGQMPVALGVGNDPGTAASAVTAARSRP
jgi:beta-N-acetylhexosaminidase